LHRIVSRWNPGFPWWQESNFITNVNDHLHNHGFLHTNHGQWRLAPAFDLNPFPDRVRELKTWISEKTGPEATIEALLSVTAYFRISHQRAFSHHQKTQIPGGPETAGNLTPLPEGSQHVSF